MYLSKIELNGFKSFAQRTVLHFDPGITAIVGPNGCGKSNIVDAVRWVIGEQRARILRSEKMENVIFNGTTRRKPLGMADVQLTIENNRSVLPTEFSEVTLGRRLFRSGDSEYLLNDVRCRLQDVTDLFMDTGMGAGAYSVIELKMVEEILSENAHDRRRLFEEAAGITRYKLRRRQALGKLDSTQVDLTRLRDLTDEIEKHVRGLKRQAEKAARFKKYEERLQRLELTLAQLELERLTGQIEALEAESALLRLQVESLTDQQETEEVRLDALRQVVAEREQALEERSQALSQHLDRARRIETDLRLNHERSEAARRDQQRIRGEQLEAVARRDFLLREHQRTALDLETALPELERADLAMEDARQSTERLQSDADAQRNVVDKRRLVLQQSESRRSEEQRKLDRLLNRIELLETERVRLQEESTQSSSELAALVEEHKISSERVEAAADEWRSAAANLQNARTEADSLASGLDEARRKLRQTERLRAAAGAEVALLESLVASYEDFSEAIQYLATSPNWYPSGLVTVSDVISCSDEDRAAVEAALAEYGSFLVVHTESDVDEALALLRSDEKGRAAFIVLDRLESFGHSSQNGHPHGHLDALLHRVHVSDASYRKLVNVLLGDCYLVDSLERARSIGSADFPARYFTRTGEWVDPRGIVYGGSAIGEESAHGVRLGRRDQLAAARATLRQLESELHEQASHVASIEESLTGLAVSALESRAEQRRSEFTEIEKLHTRLSFELDAADRRGRAAIERIAAIASELASNQTEIASLETERQRTNRSLDAMRAKLVDAQEAFARADADLRFVLQTLSEASVSSVQAHNYVTNLEKDRDRAAAEIDALDQRAKQREAELHSLEDAMAAYEKAATALRAQLDSTHDERGELRQKREEAEAALAQVRASISEVESRLRMVRQQRDQTVRDENQRAVRLAEAVTRRQDLLDHVLEDFGVSLPDAPIAIDEDFNPGPAREEVHELRERIRTLGAVNALALESFEEESQRLEFLTAQRDDLERAEKTLLETISEINVTASQQFMETFEHISENFSDIFRELFQDSATALVELTDPADPLESPIEIVARPQGKRPTGIAQLSGGEKTLTAIALLFAIYLVKPSPFCILDEVDAPLDDANVDRFMRLIRRFSESTQFILVTHNKRTMELADRMYGVTMQEQGVSKLVAVRLEEAEAELAR